MQACFPLYPPPSFPFLPLPPPTHPCPLPFPILLNFPPGATNAGLQIQRVIEKRCVYSKKQKRWNQRVKSTEKKGGKTEGGEGSVNTSVPLKPLEETDLNRAVLLFIIIKGNNPSLAQIYKLPQRTTGPACSGGPARSKGSVCPEGPMCTGGPACSGGLVC